MYLHWGEVTPYQPLSHFFHLAVSSSLSASFKSGSTRWRPGCKYRQQPHPPYGKSHRRGSGGGSRQTKLDFSVCFCCCFSCIFSSHKWDQETSMSLRLTAAKELAGGCWLVQSWAPVPPLVETRSEGEDNGFFCLYVQILLHLSAVSKQFGLIACKAAVPAVQGEASWSWKAFFPLEWNSTWR